MNTWKYLVNGSAIVNCHQFIVFHFECPNYMCLQVIDILPAVGEHYFLEVENPSHKYCTIADTELIGGGIRHWQKWNN